MNSRKYFLSHKQNLCKYYVCLYRFINEHLSLQAHFIVIWLCKVCNANSVTLYYDKMITVKNDRMTAQPEGLQNHFLYFTYATKSVDK